MKLFAHPKGRSNETTDQKDRGLAYVFRDLNDLAILPLLRALKRENFCSYR